MRVVWVVDSHSTSRQKLHENLTQERTGMHYNVRGCEHPSEIPAEHLSDPGIVAVVNAFHPDFAGFDGLKALRGLGFQGPVFLLGEPAPEQSVDPFAKDGLTGFLPPAERADWAFAAGLIHMHLNFDGKVDFMPFLAGGGRCASETIATLKDFNAFGAKLAAFVGRFGIDLNQLRRVLMGLSLAHVKNGPNGAVIDQPFQIHYGMDPRKVVLGIPAFSKGASRSDILEDFTKAVSGLKNNQAPAGSMFPEFHHVAHAAENMVLFMGSSKNAEAAMDPMLLVTSLTFAAKKAPSFFFGFSSVKQTAELSDDKAALPSNPPPAKAKTAAAEPVAAKAPEAAMPAPDASPAGTINEGELNKILTPPKLVGDVPKETAPPGTPGTGGSTAVISAASAGVEGELTPEQAADFANMKADLEKKLGDAEKEVTRLKDVCTVMSQDVRRLLKERRQPTTDRELREANQGLEEKLKGLLTEKETLEETANSALNEVELLKSQVDTLVRERDALMAKRAS